MLRPAQVRSSRWRATHSKRRPRSRRIRIRLRRDRDHGDEEEKKRMGWDGEKGQTKTRVRRRNGAERAFLHELSWIMIPRVEEAK